MTDKSFGATRRSKITTHSSLNKPNKFRVIYKSRSGALDDASSASTHTLRTHQRLMNITDTSFCTNNYSKMSRSIHNQTLSTLNPLMSNSDGIHEAEQVELSERLPRIETKPLNQPLMELQQQDIQQLSIGEVEKKVDTLIQLKLQKVNESKEQKTPETEEIDKQMNKIIRYLQREQVGQNLQVTNKKIDILEKIIAERSIESQIVKKDYYKKINNKKQKPPNISQYQVNLNDLKERTRKLMQMNPPTSIHFESTCQINYKAPNKNDYPTIQPKPKYILNNQPMPRSSYGCDYLAYRNLPKYKYEQPTSTPTILACSAGKRHSSYQEDFTVKKIEKVDFKELDCYHDKFKNLKIPLIHNKSPSFEQINQGSPSLKKFKTLQNPEEMDIKLKRFKTEAAHYIQNLSTQNQLNFRGENNNIKSAIKDRKLNKFKYAYKSIVHA